MVYFAIYLLKYFNKSIVMAEEIEKIFRALDNQTRLDIVKLMTVKKEISCQELLKKFPLSQPTMSHHFGLLLDSGILTTRKDGVRHYYKIDIKRLRSLGIDVTRL